jgi:RNase H-fold protein (predicted Holliday junction resolvase)
MRVLAIDPGRQKCGVAACDTHGVIAHRVVSLNDLADLARAWARDHRLDLVVVGSGTGSREVLSRLADVGVPVRAVEERETTLGARRRYFKDHPPRGWRRFFPVSLQIPPEPHDDYAAILLAEAYLSGVPGRRGS